MNAELEQDLKELLSKHTFRDVLGGIAEFMKWPGSDDDSLIAVGTVIEVLTRQAFWES